MWTKKGNIFNEHPSQLPVVDIYPDTFKIYYSTRDDKGRSIPMSISIFQDNLTHYYFRKWYKISLLYWMVKKNRCSLS